MILGLFRNNAARKRSQTLPATTPCAPGPQTIPAPGSTIGLIAGNGSFPARFIEGAKRAGCQVVSVCHTGETEAEVEQLSAACQWIKVGELGKLISFFKSQGVTQVAMAGGIHRVKLFGGVKLDVRGALLIARLRSTKDDVIMRGIADELSSEGITVIESTVFLTECLCPEGLLGKSGVSGEEQGDVEVGIAALNAMSAQDIGQLVVVREGVIVAVEAVEGSDAAIRRGGQLGGAGAVIVKFAKRTQDLRFDIPTVGIKTIETMIEVKARVLAVEAGRCLIMDREQMIALANRHNIAVIGCKSSEPLNQ